MTTALPIRPPRHKAFHPCSITADGFERRAHVLNVSTSGALVHLGSALAPGTPIRLRCGLLHTSGIVAWGQNLRVGIAFDTAISDVKLQAVLGTRTI